MVNSKVSYDAAVWCTNCHGHYMITIAFGYRVVDAVVGLKCDMCGCDSLMKDPNA